MGASKEFEVGMSLGGSSTDWEERDIRWETGEECTSKVQMGGGASLK